MLSSYQVNYIKVFGERNTGTRAVAQMLKEIPALERRIPAQFRTRKSEAEARLEKNILQQMRGAWQTYYLDRLADGVKRDSKQIAAWKHCAPQFDDSFQHARAAILFCVRDPYSWILALHQRAYHLHGPKPSRLSDFLDRPWATLEREQCAPVLSSPLELWNVKLRAYVTCMAEAQAAGVPTSVVRFEAFVPDPVAALRANLTDLGVDPSGLRAIATSTKDNEETLEELQARHRSRRLESRLSRADVETVNALVDWDLAAQFGYSRRDPALFPAAPRRRFAERALTRLRARGQRLWIR